jgi:DNA end-binding protein Ku
MPARALSSATLCFGLVSIPVKVFTATLSKSVRFNLLDPRDKSRVKQQYVSAATGEPVERDSLVRGYEHARGHYVVFSEDELGALGSRSDQTVEIAEFVPIAAVDPIYFAKSNLLGPDKGGHKAYRLLHEAMSDTGRVAIARHSTRGRLELVLVRPVARGLALHGLYYADEVRGFDEIELGEDVALKPGEVELAKQLVLQLGHESFEPQRYEDEYRQALVAAIERKVAGEEVVAAPRAEAREQIVDLVEALKRSLAGREPAASGAEPQRVRKPARAKGKKEPSRRRSAAG